MNINKLLALLVVAVLLLALPHATFAQSAPPLTTLSAALPSTTQTASMIVASATGITVNFSCLVDHELVKVTAISGTTLTIQRAQRGNAVGHPSGSFVLCGPAAGTFNPANGATNGVFLNSPPVGSCTATNSTYLPVVVASGADPRSWEMSNCNNGRWVDQTLIDDVPATLTRYCMPQALGVLGLLTSFGDTTAPFVVGTNTTPTAGRVYYGSIEIPKTMRLTGISLLNGTVAGTDRVDLALYRADGVGPLAKTLAGGTTDSGVGRFQDVNFTSTYLATGPARYWIALQISGTTMRVRTVNVSPGATTAGLGEFIGMLGSFLPSTTFDVLPSNLTTGPAGQSTAATALPTTLIDASAPISCVF